MTTYAVTARRFFITAVMFSAIIPVLYKNRVAFTRARADSAMKIKI